MFIIIVAAIIVATIAVGIGITLSGLIALLGTNGNMAAQVIETAFNTRRVEVKTVADAMKLKIGADNPADREKLRRAVLGLVAESKILCFHREGY